MKVFKNKLNFIIFHNWENGNNKRFQTLHRKADFSYLKWFEIKFNPNWETLENIEIGCDQKSEWS